MRRLFNPSHSGYDGLHVPRGVMDYLLFLNSKVLFKTLRKEEKFSECKPVTIHVNYHPDKYDRTRDYHVEGNGNALKPFPDGSV